MRRNDCHIRIKQIIINYENAIQMVQILTGIVTEQPQYLHRHNLSLAEMRALAIEFHDIYFTRMFACFESSLRHYWRITVRDTKPLTEQLLSSIAGRQGVPQDTLEAVHNIRKFRNFLIHEEHEIEMRFTIHEAGGYLNKYIARLPHEW
jgi:hypothetical protein